MNPTDVVLVTCNFTYGSEQSQAVEPVILQHNRLWNRLSKMQNHWQVTVIHRLCVIFSEMLFSEPKEIWNLFQMKKFHLGYWIFCLWKRRTYCWFVMVYRWRIWLRGFAGCGIIDENLFTFSIAIHKYDLRIFCVSIHKYFTLSLKNASA